MKVNQNISLCISVLNRKLDIRHPYKVRVKVSWFDFLLCFVHRPSNNSAEDTVKSLQESAKMYGSAKKETEIQNQQRIVNQLRRECKVERMKVSLAASDLMHYCEEKQLQDPFLLKIPASENPFRERRSGCLVL